MSPILRNPDQIEFELQDKVMVNGIPGWVRVKIHLDPKVYRVQTFSELLPNLKADQLTLVERFEGVRVTV